MKTSAVMKRIVAVVVVSIGVAAVSACSGHGNPTQPSALQSGTNGTSTTPFVPPTAAPTIAGYNTTLSGDGQWAFAILNGIPATGCVTMAQLQGMNLPSVNGVPALQWEVIPSPNHPNGIRIVELEFHKEIASCDPVDQQQPRDLIATGHIPIAPQEMGTTTLTFLTDRCKDGGRYEIDISLAADFNDENPSTDRQATQLIVNCGANSAGF